MSRFCSLSVACQLKLSLFNGPPDHMVMDPFLFKDCRNFMGLSNLDYNSGFFTEKHGIVSPRIPEISTSIPPSVLAKHISISAVISPPAEYHAGQDLPSSIRDCSRLNVFHKIGRILNRGASLPSLFMYCANELPPSLNSSLEDQCK